MSEHMMAPRPYGFVKVPKALFTTDGIDAYDIIVYAVLRDFAAMIQQATVFPSIKTISEMTGGKVSPSKVKKALLALRDAKALEVIERCGTSNVYAPAEYADRPVSGHRDTAGLGPGHSVSTNKTDLHIVNTTSTTTPTKNNSEDRATLVMPPLETRANRLLVAWKGVFARADKDPSRRKVPPLAPIHHATEMASALGDAVDLFDDEQLVDELARILNCWDWMGFTHSFKGVTKFIGQVVQVPAIGEYKAVTSEPVIWAKKGASSGTP